MQRKLTDLHKASKRDMYMKR